MVFLKKCLQQWNKSKKYQPKKEDGDAFVTI
jgi:hypothetical protein